jgi:hypothetical protein
MFHGARGVQSVQRVSAAGKPFIAVLRRLPGGGAVKSSKVSASRREHSVFVPPHYDRAGTVASYFHVWPSRRAAYVMYGGNRAGHGRAGSADPSHSGGPSLSSSSMANAARSLSSSTASSGAAAAEASGSGSAGGYADLGPYGSIAAPAAAGTPRPVKPFSTVELVRKFRRCEPITMVTACV